MLTPELNYGIDRGALERVLRIGGPALLAKLAAAALGNLETRRAELAAAAAAGDAAAAERAAHSIKSSAGNLGAASLAGFATEAEQRAREIAAGWREAAAALVEAVDLEALRAALAPALAEAAAPRGEDEE